jgi:hypothetical protein
MRKWIAWRLRLAAERLSPTPPRYVEYQPPDPGIGRIATALEAIRKELAQANRQAQQVKEGPQIAALITESPTLGADDSAILKDLRDRLQHGWF